jgi:hypothetical protein
VTQLQAFLLTLCIEVPIACFIAPGRRTGVLALLCSAVTHPFVWLLNEELVTIAPWPRLIALELGAVLVESAIYWIGLRDFKRALVLGAVTNAASFAIGLIIYAILSRA